MDGYNIGGFVQPGFESVKSMFESYLSSGAEHNCQLCVYVKVSLFLLTICAKYSRINNFHSN